MRPLIGGIKIKHSSSSSTLGFAAEKYHNGYKGYIITGHAGGIGTTIYQPTIFSVGSIINLEGTYADAAWVKYSNVDAKVYHTDTDVTKSVKSYDDPSVNDDIYMEDELVKKFDYNISLTRIDSNKNSDLSVDSCDFNVLLNINVSLEITVLLELIVVANIFWNLYEKHIKPQQNEAQSSGIYIVDRKHDLDFTMGPKYPEKEDFVNAFANTICEKIEESENIND